jgi:hypothetical protein
MDALKLKMTSIRGRARYSDGGDAFVPDFRSGFRRVEDDDVEALGEEFVLGATSNDAGREIARDEMHPVECSCFVFDLEDEPSLELGYLG